MSDEVKIKLTLDVDKTELDNLEKDLDDIQEPVSIPVDTDTTEAEDHLEELQNLLDEVYPHIDVDLDADEAKTDLDEIQAQVDALPPHITMPVSTGAPEAAEEFDQLQKEIEEVEESAFGLRDVFNLALGAGALGVLNDCIGASRELSGQLTKIQFGAEFVGGVELTKDELKSLSTELEKTSGFAQSNIRGLMDNYIKLGATTTEQLDGMIDFTSVYAKITGQDMTSASNAIGTAIQTGVLSARKHKDLIGIIHKATGKSTEEIIADWQNMSIAERTAYVDSLGANKDIAESADKLSNSYGESLQKMNDKITEFKAKIGEQLLPTLQWLVEKGMEVWDMFNTLTGGIAPSIAIFGLLSFAAVKIGSAVYNAGKEAYGFGKKVYGAGKDIADFVKNSDAAKKISDGLKTAWSGLKDVGGKLKKAMQGVTLATLKDTAAKIANTVWSGLQSAATWLVNAAQTALNFVMSLNPIVLVVIAIVALVAAFILAYQNCEEFRNIINAIWEAIKQFAQTIWEKIVGLGEMIKKFLSDPIKYIKMIWEKFKQWVGIKIVQIIGFFTSIPEKIKSAFKAAYDFVVGIFNDIGKAISGAIEWIKGFLGLGGGAAGGDLEFSNTMRSMNYGTQTVINVNGMVTEQSQIDYISNILGAGVAQNNIRS